LNRLTEDLLDLTKIESQSLQLHTERFNLDHVILNVLDGIVLTTQFNGTNVQILYQPQDIFLEAAAALKFTKTDGGTISVNVEKKKTEIADYVEGDNNQGVVTSVKDTGTGIDPEILLRLFTRFATKSDTGTGLGLFTSRRIVDAHGGKIWSENNSHEKGATFTFSLPLSKEKPSQATKICELIQCC
jgi:two-component system sensor histidine kinase VicK